MRRGFSLIECILAVFIVAAGMLMVFSVLPMAYRSANADKNRLTALSVARNVLAQVRSRPFGADPSSLKGDDVISGELVEGLPVQQKYTVDNVVTDIPSGADCGTVTVTVKWREGTGVGSAGLTKTLTLTGGISREP